MLAQQVALLAVELLIQLDLSALVLQLLRPELDRAPLMHTRKTDPHTHSVSKGDGTFQCSTMCVAYLQRVDLE